MDRDLLVSALVKEVLQWPARQAQEKAGQRGEGERPGPAPGVPQEPLVPPAAASAEAVLLARLTDLRPVDGQLDQFPHLGNGLLSGGRYRREASVAHP